MNNPRVPAGDATPSGTPLTLPQPTTNHHQHTQNGSKHTQTTSPHHFHVFPTDSHHFKNLQIFRFFSHFFATRPPTTKTALWFSPPKPTNCHHQRTENAPKHAQTTFLTPFLCIPDRFKPFREHSKFSMFQCFPAPDHPPPSNNWPVTTHNPQPTQSLTRPKPNSDLTLANRFLKL